MIKLFESVHLEYAQTFSCKFDHSLKSAWCSKMYEHFGNEELNVTVALIMLGLE